MDEWPHPIAWESLPALRRGNTAVTCSVVDTMGDNWVDLKYEMGRCIFCDRYCKIMRYENRKLIGMWRYAY